MIQSSRKRAKTPLIVPNTIPQPAGPTVPSKSFGPASLAEAFLELRQDNIELRNRIELLESGMSTLAEELKDRHQGSEQQVPQPLRLPFDNRDLISWDDADLFGSQEDELETSILQPAQAMEVVEEHRSPSIETMEVVLGGPTDRPAEAVGTPARDIEEVDPLNTSGSPTPRKRALLSTQPTSSAGDSAAPVSPLFSDGSGKVDELTQDDVDHAEDRMDAEGGEMDF